MIQGDGFAYELLYAGGAFTTLKIALPQGGSIKAEAGAMVAMDDTIDVEGRQEGGVLGGLARKLLTRGTFFMQTLYAERGPGMALLSPSILGDITVIDMDGSKEYFLQKSGFFASSPGIEVVTKSQGIAKGLLTGEGMFLQHVSGRGTLFVASFGALLTLDLPAGRTMIVDNHHLVAWESSASYTIEKASGDWLPSLTSGEGLVCRFRGPCRVYIQTRNPYGFAGWLSDFIPKK